MRKFKKFRKSKYYPRQLWQLPCALIHRYRHLANAKVIAVTGSCGKTSATHFLGKILSDCAPCFIGIHQNCWKSISTNLFKVRIPYEYFLHEAGVFNAET